MADNISSHDVSKILTNKVVLFCARKGGGKSFNLKRAIVRSDMSTVVIFDVRNEHGDIVPQQTSDLEELRDFLNFAVSHKGQGQDNAIRFVPYNPREEVDEFCDLIFSGYRTLLVAFEELPAYSGPGYMSPGLERLTLQARHKEIDVFGTAQRFAETSRSFTAQCDYFVLGSTNEPRDLSELVNRIGEDATRRVAKLPIRSVVTYDVEQQKLYEGLQI
jgi:hypothetical protein